MDGLLEFSSVGILLSSINLADTSLSLWVKMGGDLSVGQSQALVRGLKMIRLCDIFVKKVVLLDILKV